MMRFLLRANNKERSRNDSVRDSKNPDNLTNRFNELCSNVELSAKLEKLKKLCFAYGYVEGLKKRNNEKTP